MGAGVFNVLEGILNHHILQIHHVRFGPQQRAWDFVFLNVGGLMAIAGYLLFRTARPGKALSSADQAKP